VLIVRRSVAMTRGGRARKAMSAAASETTTKAISSTTVTAGREPEVSRSAISINGPNSPITPAARM
jgi:hypothetical protein